MIVELVGNFLGTLVAAFFGAWAAFKYENVARKQQREDEEVSAGNRALYTLSNIWNILKQYQKEVVKDWRNKEDAWLNLPVITPLDDNDTTFNIQDLSFLLGNHAGTFQEVLLEGTRFRFVAGLINRQSGLVLSEVFPRLSAANIQIAEQRPKGEIEKLLGVSTCHQLKVLVAGIIKNIDEDVASSRNAFVNLRAILKKIYPNRKFIDLPAE
ncbi:MAG: hypothetical protein WCB71_02600 [Aestuariivirga sp.]